MQDFFTFLPWLVFLALVCFSILIGASLVLRSDLKQMRLEQQQGVISQWYRRPRTRSSLKWIACALLILVGIVWWEVTAFLPRTVAVIGLLGMALIFLLINTVRAINRVVADFRSLRRTRREGLPTVWHRSPRILRGIARIFLWCTLLFAMGYAECALLFLDILNMSFSQTTVPIVVISILFLFLSATFFCYSLFMEVVNS